METTFYVDFDWSDDDKEEYFDNQLDHYFTKYARGFEHSKANKVKHAQVWCFHDTDPTAYEKFIAKLKKEWNLQGRASKKTDPLPHHRKQYGKVKGIIRDTDNCISYCVKDKCIHYKGLTDDYIEERIDASYEKEDSTQDKYNMLINILKENLPLYNVSEYMGRLNLCTEISKEWFNIYQTVLPKSMTDKILLSLGLISHEDLAKSRFFAFIGDPSFC